MKDFCCKPQAEGIACVEPSKLSSTLCYFWQFLKLQLIKAGVSHFNLIAVKSILVSAIYCMYSILVLRLLAEADAFLLILFLCLKKWTHIAILDSLYHL